MNAPVKNKLLKGETGDWEIVIGMEVHAQVSSRSKLFSGASTQFGAEPNGQGEDGQQREKAHGHRRRRLRRSGPCDARTTGSR